MGQFSPDGHWRWDGYRWVPAGTPTPPVRGGPRRPTVWTRRLQILTLVVLALGALGLLLSLLRAPTQVASGLALEVSIWRQEGIPQAEIDRLRQTATIAIEAGLAIGAVVGVAYYTVAVIGTLRRWTWWFWVQFAFCCLTALGLPLAAAGFFIHPAGVSTAAVTPLPLEIYSLVVSLLQVGLGVCLLVAGIRWGPWAAMRTEPTPQDPRPAP